MQTLTSTKELSHSEWLEQRRKGIGGSDAAAIMGLNPWKSTIDVWLDKTGQYEEKEEKGTNEKTYWGNVLEDVVAKEFSIRTGLKVRRKNAILQHKDYPFMLANVDRFIVGERAGLECKTTGQFAAKEWDNGIPVYYNLQVQHYMAVTGYPLWYVAVLIGGQEFRWYTVQRDEELIKELIQKEVEFWHMVENNIMPPLDGSEASSEILKKLYPQAEEGKQIDLPFDAFELIQKLDEITEKEKEITYQKDEIVNKLKEMLGDAEQGQVHGRIVTWRNYATKRLDSKKLQKERPDIYQEYTKETFSRRFQVK